MRILFLSNSPTPYQLNFISEVNKRGKVELFSCFLWGREKNRDWQLDIGNPFIFLANFSKTPSGYKRVIDYFLRINPDVVLIGGYLLPCSTIIMILAKLKNKKAMFWLERPLPAGFLKSIFKNIFIRLKLALADGVFAVGRVAENIYKKFSRKVFNLPYSIDIEPFLAILRKNESGRKISFLFSGQFSERKNVINLIKAFRGLNDKDIELVLIGSGVLEKEIRGLSADDSRIIIYGFVQPGSLPQFFAKSDVFVLPSLHDGWAVVINEAMAAGMPVIATSNVGAAAEYIKHQENGFICGVLPESIREALKFYTNNKELIFIHGQRNRNIITNSRGNVVNAAIYFENVLSHLFKK